MKAIALKSFMMKQTHIRSGQEFEGDENYVRQLVRNGLAEISEDLEQEPATDPDSGKQPEQNQEPEASKDPKPDQDENAKADKAKGKK